jgi:hypothetical protein
MHQSEPAAGHHDEFDYSRVVEVRSRLFRCVDTHVAESVVCPFWCELPTSLHKTIAVDPYDRFE